MSRINKRRKKNRLNFLVNPKNIFYNLTIFFLSLIIIGFIYSFLTNYNDTDKIQFNNSYDLKKLLVINDYEKKTGHRIRVEILNGCGAPGLADKYSNLFRKNGYDVILSKNALNFDYEKSQIILRRGNIDFAMQAAEVMDISKDNIQEDLNELLDCDVTIILGKDYNQLQSFSNAIALSPPY